MKTTPGEPQQLQPNKHRSFSTKAPRKISKRASRNKKLKMRKKRIM